MIKILNFNNFNKKLYVFDFDDTLVHTPQFEVLALRYIKENKTVKDLLTSSLTRINKSLSDLRYENGRIYIDDPQSIIKPIGNWVRKGKRMYLTTPDLFSYMDESLPNEIKPEIVSLYNSVEDKCIVTARPEGSRQKIEESLRNLNLKLPKWGLYMRPDGLNGAGTWKGNIIVDLVNKYNFGSVVFYDDNSKYIKLAKRVVNEKLPNLKFETVKVS